MNESTVRSVPADTRSGLALASYVDWPAILAGAVLATAMAFLFSTFGAALGLSLVSPYAGESAGGMAVIIAVGLWMLWTTISSSMAGGYLAGRMRRPIDDARGDEVHVRDGAHGVVVWGLGVLLGAALLTSTVGTTARVGGAAVASATQAAASVAGGAASAVGSTAKAASGLLPDNVSANPIDYTVDTLFRAPAAADTASPEIDRASAPAVEQVKSEAMVIFASLVRTGDMPGSDQEYLQELVAEHTGLSKAEVETRVVHAMQAVESAREEAERKAAEVEDAARAAADTARRYAIMSAFVIAASLLIAGAGAYWAASVGGRHRDDGIVHHSFGRWN